MACIRQTQCRGTYIIYGSDKVYRINYRGIQNYTHISRELWPCESDSSKADKDILRTLAFLEESTSTIRHIVQIATKRHVKHDLAEVAAGIWGSADFL
jgi:hypothetical protein